MADRVGQRFGNYRLARLLGQGGHAEVYLGQHVRLELQAAIKILHTHLTGGEAEQFYQEAQTIAKLTHPSIVRVFDFDVQDGIPFLVMDYAPNSSLRQRFPHGSLVSLPVIVSAVKQVAAALQYAHERKFIHRDVKPENMLLGRQQEVLLSDFGIATIAHSTTSLSASMQTTGGTIPYMAPEQIEGRPRAASDQYALGVVVYEWLCGARPFEGSVTEVMVKHLSMPPPSLRERMPTISAEIEQAVLRALAKEPKARFASVQAFAKALEQASWEEQTALAIPETPFQSVPILLQTQPPPQLATLPAFEEPSPYDTPPSRGEGGEPPVVRPAVTPHKPKAEARTPEHAFASAALIRAGHGGLSRSKAALLAGLVLLMVILSSVGVYPLIAPRHATLLQSTATAAANAYNAAVAANGVMFGFDAAHTHFNPYERILTPASVSRLVQMWTFSSAGALDSSPAVANGIVYVGSSDGSLYALDARSGSKLWSFATGNQIASSPAVANGIVYVGSSDGSLYALDAHSDNKLWSFASGNAISSSPAVANGIVYVGSHDHWLYALDARSGSKLWSLATGNAIFTSAAVANGVVYVGSSDGSLYALDAHSGSKLWSFASRNAINSSPVVANGVVYIGSQDDSLYALDAHSGSKLWSFATRSSIDTSPAVANGIVYIGSFDGRVYAFSLPS